MAERSRPPGPPVAYSPSTCIVPAAKVRKTETMAKAVQRFVIMSKHRRTTFRDREESGILVGDSEQVESVSRCR